MRLFNFLFLMGVLGLAFPAFAMDHGDKNKDKNKTDEKAGSKPNPAAANQAPAFSLPDINGKNVSLSEFKDKVVVMEWASLECAYTEKFYKDKDMQKWEADYTAKGKDVIWLTIFTGADPKKVADWAKAKDAKATYYLIDKDGTVAKLYEAAKTPYIVVIGKDGVRAYCGAIDDKPTTESKDIADAKNFLKAALDAILSGKPVAQKLSVAYGSEIVITAKEKDTSKPKPGTTAPKK
jgi:peroxiredoxin